MSNIFHAGNYSNDSMVQLLSNVSNPIDPQQQHDWYSITCAILVALNTVVGIVVYSLFISIFYRYRRTKFSQNSFYVIVHNLALADILFLVSHVSVALPYTLARTQIYPDWIDWVLCHAVSTAFYAISFFSFLIAANRFLIFTAPRANHKLFHHSAAQHWCVGAWLLSLALNIVNYAALSQKMTFRTDNVYIITYAAVGQPTHLQLVIFRTMSTFLPALLACFMLTLYVSTFIVLAQQSRRSKAQRTTVRAKGSVRRQRRERGERSLLCQGLLIALSLIVTNSVFALAEHLPARFTWILALIQLWTAPINSALSPVIYFTLNSTVRSCAMQMYFGVDPQADSSTTTLRPDESLQRSKFAASFRSACNAPALTCGYKKSKYTARCDGQTATEFEEPTVHSGELQQMTNRKTTVDLGMLNGTRQEASTPLLCATIENDKCIGCSCSQPKLLITPDDTFL